MSESKKEINASNFYGDDALCSKDDFVAKHKFNMQGLTHEEAQKNISVV